MACQSLVGDRGGFCPSRSTIFPHHSRTGDPTVIKSLQKPHQGAGYILSKICAANKHNKFFSSFVTFSLKNPQHDGLQAGVPMVRLNSMASELSSQGTSEKSWIGRSTLPVMIEIGSMRSPLKKHHLSCRICSNKETFCIQLNLILSILHTLKNFRLATSNCV